MKRRRKAEDALLKALERAGVCSIPGRLGEYGPVDPDGISLGNRAIASFRRLRKLRLRRKALKEIARLVRCVAKLADEYAGGGRSRQD